MKQKMEISFETNPEDKMLDLTTAVLKVFQERGHKDIVVYFPAGFRSS